MRQRVAAHFIWYKQALRLHYVERDAKGLLTGVFPLEQEIASTAFLDGVIVVFPSPLPFESVEECLSHWQLLSEGIKEGDEVTLVHLQGLPAASARLGRYDGEGKNKSANLTAHASYNLSFL